MLGVILYVRREVFISLIALYRNEIDLSTLFAAENKNKVKEITPINTYQETFLMNREMNYLSSQSTCLILGDCHAMCFLAID